MSDIVETHNALCLFLSPEGPGKLLLLKDGHPCNFSSEKGDGKKGFFSSDVVYYLVLSHPSGGITSFPFPKTLFSLWLSHKDNEYLDSLGKIGKIHTSLI